MSTDPELLPSAGDGPVPGTSAAERLVDRLLADAHLAGPYDLPALLERHSGALGCTEALVYLADLQQNVLVPFLAPERPDSGEQVQSLAVDATLAGRAYQQVQVLTQDLPDGSTRVWIPLLNGIERLGVIAVTVPDPAALDVDDGLLRRRLKRLAALTAELVMTKTMYGDTIVRLRRTNDMGLAAEIQWQLLPPLTCATPEVTVAGALEPAYRVAGDTVDYAVDPARTCVAVFDGMGHGMQAAQLAVLAVAAYRNARRAGRTLIDTLRAVDAAVAEGFGGEAFTTAVIAELATDTGLLRWVNAGHPEPLLLRDHKVLKALHVDPELPLGLGPSVPRAVPAAAAAPPAPPVPSVGTEQLQPGDRVLLYTDGVVEARSPEGELFGIERLTDLVNVHFAGGLPASETMRRVVRALLEHQQGQLSDDASLLLLEWRSGNEDKLLY